MTNLERIMAILERHREARRWSDEDVAREVLATLGVEPHVEVMTAEEAATVDPPASVDQPPA